MRSNGGSWYNRSALAQRGAWRTFDCCCLRLGDSDVYEGDVRGVELPGQSSMSLIFRRIICLTVGSVGHGLRAYRQLSLMCFSWEPSAFVLLIPTIC
jgi:hypothetical protein